MSNILKKFEKINERWKNRPAEPASPEFLAFMGTTPERNASKDEDDIYLTKWHEEFILAFLEERHRDARRRERDRERYLRRKAHQ